MRILLAPDKFKGCLTAPQVCAAMAEGIRRVDSTIDIDQCPIADGGEGTVEALITATGGRFETRSVTGPRPDMHVAARFGILGDNTTAVIEMAAASGLALLPPEDRNPMLTTTYGTGELLVAAAQLGISKIILGIGGSATNDGGIGAAQAAGLPVILDTGPADAREPLIGEDLRRVVLVKHGRGSALDRVAITVACDVTNPLFGPNGASHIYGPQKGATRQQIEELDALLKRLAERTGKLDAASAPGAGAAGGLGFAMLAFFGATLRPGFDIVADAVRLRDRIAQADLVLTGEGRLDTSSLAGKTAIGVARMCRDANVPCYALAGAIEAGLDTAARAEGIAGSFAISPGDVPLDQSLREAAPRLAEAAQKAVQQFRHA